MKLEIVALSAVVGLATGFLAPPMSRVMGRLDTSARRAANSAAVDEPVRGRGRPRKNKDEDSAVAAKPLKRKKKMSQMQIDEIDLEETMSNSPSTLVIISAEGLPGDKEVRCCRRCRA